MPHRAICLSRPTSQALRFSGVRGFSSSAPAPAATVPSAGAAPLYASPSAPGSSVSSPLRIALLGQPDSVFARLGLVQRAIDPSFDLDAPGTLSNLSRDPCLVMNINKVFESRVITMRMPLHSQQPDEQRSVELLIYRAHSDLIKALLWNDPSAPQAAIVCLDACNTRSRLQELLRENLRVLPKQIPIVVYLMRTDQIAEPPTKENASLQQLREMIAEELVTQGFDSPTTEAASSTPVILGVTESVDGQSCPDTASIRALLQSMHTHLAASPQVELEEPYMLSVESLLPSADQTATIVRGWDRGLSWAMASGKLPAPGESVDLIGARGEKLFSNAVVQSSASDPDSLTLRGSFLHLDQVRRSPEYLVSAGSDIQSWNEIEAEIYLLTPEEGGRYAPLVSNSPVLCGLGVHPAVVQLSPSLLNPADRATITPEQPSASWMSVGVNRRVRVFMGSNGVARVGQRFWLGSPSNIGQFIALGRVTKLIGKLPDGAAPLTLPRMSLGDRLRVAEGLLCEMMNVPQPGLPRVTTRANARRNLWILGVASFAAGLFLPPMLW